MSTRAVQKKANGSAPKSKHKHPLRIVPLHPFARDVSAAAPHLTYRNGLLLTNVEVFTIFWGAAWQEPANANLPGEVNVFFDFILTSSLMDQLAEYSVPGHTIGHGSRIGTTTLTAHSPGKSVTDSAIQKLIQAEITSSALPAPTPNTLYFLYLPPGTTVKQTTTQASCKNFCGYHEATRAGNIFYAVMPYPGCAGCLGTLETFTALTSTSSHELCESITDPIPGQGWYDDSNGEIGDICAWKTKQLGAYTVQLEWSNAKNACT
jgi:hypothetical protein